MDAHEFEAGNNSTDLASLTQRVAELERVVAELRGVGAVARPMAAPPPPPMPAVPMAPAQVRFAAAPVPVPVPVLAAPQKSLEDRLGSQVFNAVGILALVCGSAYFLKLAIDHGWLGYTARVLIGLVAGAGLVVWSESFRRKKMAAFSYSLKAVGTSVLYLSLWYEFQYHHLLPAPVVLGAMILVTAWNAWMAVSQDAELLAGYALAGGLLTPLLLSTGGNHETFLFTYMAAIALGVVYLLRTKAWQWLLIPAFVGSAGYFAGWFSEFFHHGSEFSRWDGESTETAVFAFVFFAIFALPTVKGWSSLPEPAAKTAGALVPVLLPLVNAAFLALALFAIFDGSGLHSSRAFLMVGLAALFLGVMRLQRSALGGAMYLAAAVVCLTIAVPLKASGHSLTTAWLVEGLVLYWAGTRFSAGESKEQSAPAVVLWVLSLGGYVLGLGSLVVHWGGAMLFGGQPQFFNSNLGAAMVAVVTLAGAAWLAHREGNKGEAVPLLAIDGVAVLLALREIASWGSDAHPAFANADFATALLGLAVLAGACFAAYRISAGRSPIAAGNFVLANLVAILIFVREIGALFAGEDLERALAISGFLMAYGAALLAIGFVKQSAFVRWQALVLLIFTIGKVFLFDTSGLSAGYRVASLMGLGAVLMGVSYAYQKDWLGLKAAPHPSPVAAPEEGPR